MRTLKTFIVEDNPLILDSLVQALEEMAPVRVVGHAADEDAALEQMQCLDDDLDLVLVDIFLHSGSGLGVLRHATTAGLRARRVVLTNYATPDMRAHCERLGAERVFDKSHELDDLLDYCALVADAPA